MIANCLWEEQKERAQWDDIKRAYLLKLLLEHSSPKHRGQTGWTKDAWMKITRELNLKFANAHLRKDQIKDQEQQLKKTYKVLKKLLELSGFSWDYNNNMIAAPEDVWQPLLEEDRRARKWHNKSWPHYPACQELYDGRSAEDKQSCGVEDCAVQSDLQQPASSPPSTPTATIPNVGETSQRFDSEQELEEVGDTNIDPSCTRALLPPPTAAQKQPTRRPCQMSENSSVKKLKSSVNTRLEFSERYMAMRREETDHYLEATESARQPLNDRSVFTINRCILAFNKLEGFTSEDMLKATEIFKSPDDREIFLSLREDQRVIWLKAKVDEM